MRQDHQRLLKVCNGPTMRGYALCRHCRPFIVAQRLLQEPGLLNVRRQVLEIFFTLASHYEATAEHDLAHQYAWRQIELEPWREEAHGQLMRMLALSGQRSAALTQFTQCRTILADELGVDPEAETLALYETIRTGKLGAVPQSGAAPTSAQAPESVEAAGIRRLRLRPQSA
jgi:DNA-binding SARP family transcriptional activator